VDNRTEHGVRTRQPQIERGTVASSMIRASRATSAATFDAPLGLRRDLPSRLPNSRSRWISAGGALRQPAREWLLPAPEMPITRHAPASVASAVCRSRAAFQRWKSSPCMIGGARQRLDDTAGNPWPARFVSKALNSRAVTKRLTLGVLARRLAGSGRCGKSTVGRAQGLHQLLRTRRAPRPRPTIDAGLGELVGAISSRTAASVSPARSENEKVTAPGADSSRVRRRTVKQELGMRGRAIETLVGRDKSQRTTLPRRGARAGVDSRTAVVACGRESCRGGWSGARIAIGVLALWPATARIGLLAK